MSNTTTRTFRVKGNLKSYFQLDKLKLGEEILLKDIEVQLWHKDVTEVFYLGNGFTDSEANFNIEFSLDSSVGFIVDGKIENTYLEAYYKNVKLSVLNNIDLGRGLVAYWKLDELSGDTAADATGRGHNGTLGGSVVPTWAAGKINNGLQINGGSSGTDISKLTVPVSTDFNFGTGDFTLALWMKTYNSDTFYYLLDTGYPTPGCILFEYNNTSKSLYLYFALSPTYYKPIIFSLDSWYHIVLRRINGIVDVCVNGTSIGVENVTDDINAPSDLVFGMWGTLSMNGMMDEIGIWKGHGLNDAEIAALYNNGEGWQYPFNQ